MKIDNTELLRQEEHDAIKNALKEGLSEVITAMEQGKVTKTSTIHIVITGPAETKNLMGDYRRRFYSVNIYTDDEVIK